MFTSIPNVRLLCVKQNEIPASHSALETPTAPVDFSVTRSTRADLWQSLKCIPCPWKNLKMACSHSNLSPKAKLTSNQHLRLSPSLHAGVRLQKLCQATRFRGAVMESRDRRGSKRSSKFESFTFSQHMLSVRAWLNCTDQGTVLSHSDGVPHFQAALLSFPTLFFPPWSNLACSPGDLNRSDVPVQLYQHVALPVRWDLDRFQGHVLCCC